jgi:ABC-2 type transport system permease protein
MIAISQIKTVYSVKTTRLLAYRAEMLIWILAASFPLVMLALWNAVAQDNASLEMTSQDISQYFAVTLLVRQLTGCWIIWQLNLDIRNGTLSAQLLRPVNPLVVNAIWMLAALPLRVAYLTPVLLILSIWMPDVLFLPQIDNLLLFIFSVGFAWTLNFLIQAIFGVLAFWLDRTESLFGIWLGIWLVFSGYTIPLQLFPDSVKTLLRLLPFRSQLGTPIEILTNQLLPSEILSAIGLQMVWVVICAAVLGWVWKAGLKRYGAFGA